MNLELVQKIQYFRERFDEIEKAKAHFLMLEGKFNDEFKPWLKAFNGGRDNFTLIDIIEKTYEASK